jgi:hypothetical protein
VGDAGLDENLLMPANDRYRPQSGVREGPLL